MRRVDIPPDVIRRIETALGKEPVSRLEEINTLLVKAVQSATPLQHSEMIGCGLRLEPLLYNRIILCLDSREIDLYTMFDMKQYQMVIEQPLKITFGFQCLPRYVLLPNPEPFYFEDDHNAIRFRLGNLIREITPRVVQFTVTYPIDGDMPELVAKAIQEADLDTKINIETGFAFSVKDWPA